MDEFNSLRQSIIWPSNERMAHSTKYNHEHRKCCAIVSLRFWSSEQTTLKYEPKYEVMKHHIKWNKYNNFITNSYFILVCWIFVYWWTRIFIILIQIWWIQFGAGYRNNGFDLVDRGSNELWRERAGELAHARHAHIGRSLRSKPKHKSNITSIAVCF